MKNFGKNYESRLTDGAACAIVMGKDLTNPNTSGCCLRHGDGEVMRYESD